MNIGILGTGAFGTALANVLSEKKQNNVFFYGVCEEEAKDLEQGYNKRITNKKLNRKFKVFFNNLNGFINQKPDVILLAIPSKFISSTLKTICINKTIKNSIFLNVAKGLNPNTLEIWSNEIFEIFIQNKISKNQLVQLAGPSFAVDILDKQITYVNVAGLDNNICKKIKNIFDCNYFTVNIINDLNGIQICSAIKNIYAIGSGIVYTLYKTSNTRTAYMTMVLKEMKDLLKIYKGKESTLLDFCGIGDALLTCNDEKSRNFSLGKSLVEIGNKALETSNTIEGYICTKIIYNKLKKLNTLNNFPILKNIYSIIYNNKNPEIILK